MTKSSARSAQQNGFRGDRPGTASGGRTTSRPSSASRPGSAARPQSRQQRPSTAAPRTQTAAQGPCLQQSMAHEKCTLRPRTGRSSQAGSVPGGINEIRAGPPNPWATTNDTYYGCVLFLGKDPHAEVGQSLLRIGYYTKALCHVWASGHVTDYPLSWANFAEYSFWAK